MEIKSSKNCLCFNIKGIKIHSIVLVQKEVISKVQIQHEITFEMTFFKPKKYIKWIFKIAENKMFKFWSTITSKVTKHFTVKSIKYKVKSINKRESENGHKIKTK